MAPYFPHPTLNVDFEDTYWDGVIISVVACVCLLVAFTGNSLVLMSFMRDKRLRNVHSIYIVNLAVCDMLLTSTTVPRYITWASFGFDWVPRPSICKTIIIADRLLVHMSAVLVVLESWDRLSLVSLGGHYAMVETQCMALAKLLICWVGALLFHGLPIMLHVRGHIAPIRTDCCPEDFENPYFLMSYYLLSVLIPLAFLLTNLFRLRRARNKNLFLNTARMVADTASAWTHTNGSKELFPGFSVSDLSVANFSRYIRCCKCYKKPVVVVIPSPTLNRHSLSLASRLSSSINPTDASDQQHSVSFPEISQPFSSSLHDEETGEAGTISPDVLGRLSLDSRCQRIFRTRLDSLEAERSGSLEKEVHPMLDLNTETSDTHRPLSPRSPGAKPITTYKWQTLEANNSRSDTDAQSSAPCSVPEHTYRPALPVSLKQTHSEKHTAFCSACDKLCWLWRARVKHKRKHRATDPLENESVEENVMGSCSAMTMKSVPSSYEPHTEIRQENQEKNVQVEKKWHALSFGVQFALSLRLLMGQRQQIVATAARTKDVVLWTIMEDEEDNDLPANVTKGLSRRKNAARQRRERESEELQSMPGHSRHNTSRGSSGSSGSTSSSNAHDDEHLTRKRAHAIQIEDIIKAKEKRFQARMNSITAAIEIQLHQQRLEKLKKNQECLRRERLYMVRLVMHLAIVLLLLWLPSSVICIVEVILGRIVNMRLRNCMMMLLLIRCCVNPLVYIINSYLLQRNVKRLLLPIVKCVCCSWLLHASSSTELLHSRHRLTIEDVENASGSRRNSPVLRTRLYRKFSGSSKLSPM